MKKQQKQKTKKEESALTLGDRLDNDIFKQLKERQQELKAAEEKRKEEEERKKSEARRLKEKNKSFEELLNESHMDWHQFKD